MLIDLHGLVENEVILELDGFLVDFQESQKTECKIITGKGIVLSPLVIDTLEHKGFKWKYDGNNHGAIIVYK